MSETHSLTRIRQTDYICDHCGEGRMIFTGASWMVQSPAQPVGTKIYCHRCDVCGMQVNFMTVYPRTEYLPEVNQ
jgi:MinD superfamily P-loop ATPase